jgi:hypothetical protein
MTRAILVAALAIPSTRRRAQHDLGVAKLAGDRYVPTREQPPDLQSPLTESDSLLR